MQVNLNIPSDLRVKSDARPVARRNQTTPADHATFNQSAAIERALKDQPDARPEAVARGEQLIGSPQYPPMAGIQGISRLLAANWPTRLE